MKRIWAVGFLAAIALSGCTTGPLAIQKITSNGEEVLIEYDPNQRSNSQMREMAQAECKKSDRILKDVTVAKTQSPTTSIARVYCE